MEVLEVSEWDGLTAKQILIPDTSRGFNKYARWKSAKPIIPLREQGLSFSKIHSELKLIHKISSTAYRKSEIICSKLLLQICAGFSLSISMSSFVIFIVTLIICASVNRIRETLHEDDAISHLIIDSITMKNVIIICLICSIITISFMFIGVYIMYKSSQNKMNQYIESILAVHEHIQDRLLIKYEKYGIIWKLKRYTKDTKRMSIFGTKKDITYYGIVIKLMDGNDIDNSNNDNTDNDDDDCYISNHRNKCSYNINGYSTDLMDENISDYNDYKPTHRFHTFDEDLYDIITTPTVNKDDCQEEEKEDKPMPNSKVEQVPLLLLLNGDESPLIGSHIRLTDL